MKLVGESYFNLSVSHHLVAPKSLFLLSLEEEGISWVVVSLYEGKSLSSPRSKRQDRGTGTNSLPGCCSGRPGTFSRCWRGSRGSRPSSSLVCVPLLFCTKPIQFHLLWQTVWKRSSCHLQSCHPTTVFISSTSLLVLLCSMSILSGSPGSRPCAD